jgi:hypothetical protein
VNIDFLSTVAVIAPDPPHSRKLYVDALGLPLDGEAGDYQHRADWRLQVFRHLAAISGGRGMLRHPGVAGGAARAAGSSTSRAPRR